MSLGDRSFIFFLIAVILLAISAQSSVAAIHPVVGADSKKSPAIYYLISDLHIGGDGALDHCDFEPELIDFLKKVAGGPRPAELIIAGDSFGLWEMTETEGVSKLQKIAANHPSLFNQFRETGRSAMITIIPGNHDYDLACAPGYKDDLAAYNIRLESATHITRSIAGRTIWIEHGNQHDAFNDFPDFGNRYALPAGYFITEHFVAAAGRSAPRGRSQWLNNIESVYPSEEIPIWVISNYFYKEMTPILRWFLLPFLVLFAVSVIVFIGRALERAGIIRTTIFSFRLRSRYGLPGGLIDLVFWVNGVVISFLLVLAVPAYFLHRDMRAALTRYGVDISSHLKEEKDRVYLDAAEAVFRENPSVVLYVYGHTHDASLKKLGSRYVINTGTWLTRLGRTSSWFRLVPDVYVPSHRLNYFTVSQRDGEILLRYQVIPKEAPATLTLLEKLMILGRRTPGFDPIPAETTIPAG